MALETYRKKRDFSVTREPKGKTARKAGNSFVIQKHDATRLHYDFRLEMDGVLKSWAVTRGPSLVPGEKRLAVHVEDHPLDYGGFEGTIPKGEYGGGTVIIWDRGSWAPVHDAAKGFAKGHIEFTLEGEKLKGRWHLIRMERKPREKQENWLLIKGEDEFAREPGDPDILEERPESVKSGRQISDVAGEAPGWSSKTGKIDKAAPVKSKPKPTGKPKAGKSPPVADPSKIKGAKAAALPHFLEPALASPAPSPPNSERWLHEIKFDGYRLQARIQAGNVKLMTRSGLDWTKKFGKPVVAALHDLPLGTALLDGELVVENSSHASDFSALQLDLSEGRSDRFLFYAFDLLHLDGFDLTGVPLVERKRLLRQLINGDTGLIRYSDHFEEDGALVLRHACRLSLEGIVSKLKDSVYRSGRGKSWIKAKCAMRQEFVVAGFMPSSTVRRAIGSLVLGIYEGDKLMPVGRVGTGFTTRIAEDLFARLERIRATASPFSRPLSTEEARQVRYVRPELVAEIEFRAWTADANLRHASFRGLREDKPARDIIRETVTSMTKASKPEQHSIKLSHPDRVYWPEQGVTKEGLADYYTEIWPHIAPFIINRPLALLRCPSGIDGEKFFQKHAWKGVNPNIIQSVDPTAPSEEPLISIKDLDGLIGLVQSAVLEIHPWGATLSDWERPDMIIMDLDPGEGVAWESVIAAAQETRQRLSQAGLSAFVKTSGGKGLHVVAPLTRKAEWPAIKSFCKGIADAMAGDSPERFVSTITKSKRHGKILVDYLRNQRGATAVAAYSTRARPGAPVSAPLSWQELDGAIGPAFFTLENMPTRLASLPADPWQDFWNSAVPLPASKAGRRKVA